jgi:hypothetical protein
LRSIALKTIWHVGHNSSPFDSPPQLPQRVADEEAAPFGVWPTACPSLAALAFDAVSGCVFRPSPSTKPLPRPVWDS